MLLKLSFRATFRLATSALCLNTVAQGAETAISPTTALQTLATSVSFALVSQLSPPPPPPSSSSTAPQGITTLVISSTSTKLVTSTISPSPSQTHDKSSVPEPEHGQEYGNVIVRNHCNETLYLNSVGAWPLGGPRNDIVGWGAEPEKTVHVISPGSAHTEPYRMTCPIPLNHTGNPEYCPSQDKLQGQGVSLKIAKKDPNKSPDTIQVDAMGNSKSPDIIQVEYALVQNPHRNDTFKRLDYDISLLDCANPIVRPEAFTPHVAGVSRNVTLITDFSATTADHAKKVEMCPGYRDGLRVTFPSDPTGGNCRPIRCDGSEMCMNIYTFDRTRQNESSIACHREYRGDMVVDLCAGRMDATVKAS